MFDGPAFTFGKNPADLCLFQEASTDSRDLAKVSTFVKEYNTFFNEIETKTPDLSDEMREVILLMLRNQFLSRIGITRWRNPKVVTFLRNNIKTRFTIYTRKDNGIQPTTLER